MEGMSMEDMLQNGTVEDFDSRLDKAAHTKYSRILSRELIKCLRQMDAEPTPIKSELFCPRVFDGWSCWNDTPAGEVAYTPCPPFMTGFDPNREAHKVCNPDGTWYRHPITNKTWSNYTTCVDMDDLNVRRIINHVFVAGYCVSMTALIISLVIFFHFRTLRCTRIRIHKNLFISFIINNGLWILWYREVVDKTELVVISNEIGCQVLHILVHYFMLASYFWMFCEGVYLHTLLVIAFVSEEKVMRWCYLVGWGIPGVIMAVYGGVRGASNDDTRHCWMNESHYMWILSTPVCISLVTNFVFLINIVRVLVTKLRANHIPYDANGTRKAVKATLILIPLLGLHYVVTPFRPEQGAPGEIAYHIVSAIVSSLQGFFVALLFCFFNSEVISAVKKQWSQFRFMHQRKRRRRRYSAYSVSLNGHHVGPSFALRCHSFNETKKGGTLLVPTLETKLDNEGEETLGTGPASFLNRKGVRQSTQIDNIFSLEEGYHNNQEEGKNSESFTVDEKPTTREEQKDQQLLQETNTTTPIFLPEGKHFFDSDRH